MNLAEAIPAAIGRHPSVKRVALAGSRARGEEHPLQDWDFFVTTDDFQRVANDLPGLVEPLSPLGTLWDPLAEHACYMLIVDGPHKVDLLFDAPPTNDPAPVDVHFWDWTLWLAGKVLGGKHALVRSELMKMSDYLLAPLGIGTVPADVAEAVGLYLSVRGDDVDRELRDAVMDALRRNDLL